MARIFFFYKIYREPRDVSFLRLRLGLCIKSFLAWTRAVFFLIPSTAIGVSILKLLAGLNTIHPNDRFRDELVLFNCFFTRLYHFTLQSVLLLFYGKALGIDKKILQNIKDFGRIFLC